MDIELEKLKGSTLTDVETNSNGFTVLYFETKNGEVYAVDLCPTVRHLNKIEGDTV